MCDWIGFCWYGLGPLDVVPGTVNVILSQVLFCRAGSTISVGDAVFCLLILKSYLYLIQDPPKVPTLIQKNIGEDLERSLRFRHIRPTESPKRSVPALFGVPSRPPVKDFRVQSNNYSPKSLENIYIKTCVYQWKSIPRNNAASVK